MSTVVLAPYQLDHVRRLIQIFNMSPGAVDGSQMGSGKTVTTTFIAANVPRPGMNVLTHGAMARAFTKMIAVVPASLRSNWHNECRRQNMPLEVYSYDEIIGTKFRYLYEKGGNYYPTDEWLDLVDQGVLLVYDEFSYLKNKGTKRTLASHALSRSIGEAMDSMGTASYSRILAVSATPIDKSEQAFELIKTIALCPVDSLFSYERESRQYTRLGINNIYCLCRSLNPGLADEINNNTVVSAAGFSEACYRYYTEILMQNVSSSMKKQALEKYTFNGYFNMEHDDYARLRKGVNQLKDAVGFREGEVNKTKGKGNGNLSAIAKASVEIEAAKMNTIIRVARHTLESNINSKVLIFVRFSDSVDRVMKGLAEYFPIALVGDVKEETRDKLIAVFQQPNTHRRVIVANIDVASVGLNMGDEDGRFPRTIFISPNYSFISVQQASGRCTRATSKSVATVFIVYGKSKDIVIDPTDQNQISGLYGDLLEQSIFDALARKTEVTRASVIESDKTLYPGEYDIFIEPQHLQ
uniref:Helicase n=1 Tax=viral metagenome TaxID=1070528 RepID=A0A6C0BP35_9ZZZZ